MKQIIHIFISNKEVELAQPLDISMTYQEQDFTNPTVVKVGYSKTLELQGTQRNNEVFGDIWNLHRMQEYHDGTYSGAYFDPSKRASCQIYHNNDLIEDGYVKLDDITINGGKITYNLTYYAGLADFFYSMSYNDDGDQLTLADLPYTTEGGSDVDLTFNITKDNINEAWNSLEEGNDDKWSIINFAPTNQGIPDNLAADAAIINLQGNHSFTISSVTEDSKTYTATGGYVSAELSKEYNEWEMGDIRSYLQRPVLSVKGLWRGLQNKAKDLGWTIDLDKTFFHNDNPYYASSWITLPRLSSLDAVGGDSYTGTTENNIVSITQNQTGAETKIIVPSALQDTAGETIPVESNAINFSEEQNGKIQVSVPFSLYSTTPSEARQLVTSLYQNGAGGFTVQLLVYDGNTIVGGSDVYNFTTSAYGESADLGDYENWNPVYGSNSVKVGGSFEEYGHGYPYRWSNDGTTQWTLSAKAPVTYNSKISFKIRLMYCYTSSLAEGGRYKLFSSILPHLHTTYSFSIVAAGYGDGEDTFTEYDTVNSGTKITQAKLLQGSESPCDYMLSYTKLFGLYWKKDDYTKTVSVMTRNNFYDGEVMEFDEYIDRQRGQKITPLSFTSKYYDMSLEMDESHLSKQYKSDYNAVYGRQRINTGYNFDSSINDLYESNVYKGGVTGLDSSTYYRHFRNGSYWYPSCLYDGLTYTLTSSDDSTYDVTCNMKEYRYINWNVKGGYDLFPKLCLHDSSDSPVDGNNILIFFNGFKQCNDVNGNAVDFWITDDLGVMYSDNDEQACWLITDSETDKQGNTIAIKKNSLPMFGRYYTVEDSDQIEESWDFGEPKELYCDYTSKDTTTLYNQFWKNMLTDQLSVNAKVLETYVLLDKKVLGEMLRKLYYFNNSYWVLNKISDYNICSYSPTKCQFIKVMDTASYTSGQKIIPAKTTYSISYTLSNVSMTNTATSVREGSSYSSTVSANSGYNVDSVAVTMGGTDITSTAYDSTTNAISIGSVTGNISITASGSEIPVPTKTEYEIQLSITGEYIDVDYALLPYTATLTDTSLRLPDNISVPVKVKAYNDTQGNYFDSVEGAIYFNRDQFEWSGDKTLKIDGWKDTDSGEITEIWVNEQEYSSFEKTKVAESDDYVIYLSVL